MLYLYRIILIVKIPIQYSIVRYITMYIVWRTMYVQCALSSSRYLNKTFDIDTDHCTLYDVHCTLYSIRCIMSLYTTQLIFVWVDKSDLGINNHHHHHYHHQQPHHQQPPPSWPPPPILPPTQDIQVLAVHHVWHCWSPMWQASRSDDHPLMTFNDLYVHSIHGRRRGRDGGSKSSTIPHPHISLTYLPIGGASERR